MDLLFGLIFLFLIILGIFSFFEITFIRIFFEIKSTKYMKLLKILEITVFLFAFIMLTSLKISTILLSLIYFIINFIFLFVDFYSHQNNFSKITSFLNTYVV